MSDPFIQADNASRLAKLVSFGTIAEVDLTATPATARVEIEDDLVTDHLPVFQLSAGRVRSWSAPMVGEQVMVLSPSGETGAGAVLRGLNYDGFPAPTADELTTVLASWEDGAVDLYDEATKTRAIAIPAGGALTMAVGPLTIRIAAGGITLTSAGQPITLDGPVNLGGSGGQAVARVGDPVVNNKISAGSSTVKAA